MECREQFRSIAFSRDGKTVLTPGLNLEARLWNAATGQSIGKPLRHESNIKGAEFSPDGNLVLTWSHNDRTARLWDASTGRPIKTPMVHRYGVDAAEFSPDGKSVLTASADGSCRLWDTATVLPIGAPLEPEASGKITPFWKLSFSPDGKTFLIQFDPDHTVHLVYATSGSRIGKPLAHVGEARVAAFSPDGKTVLTGSPDGSARLWDAATGQQLGAPVVHPGRVWAAAYSPDCRSFLTASEGGEAWLWEIPPGLPLGQPLDRDSAYLAAFSPDGTTILTSSLGEVGRLWDARTGSPIGQPMKDPDLWTAVFSPDGKTILTGSRNNSVRLWDAATGQPVSQPIRLSDAPPADIADGQGGIIADWQGRVVSTVAYNRSGTMFLAINRAGTVVLWDATSQREVAHQTNADCAAFSPDGRFVAIGSRDKTAQLWDIATGGSVGAPLKHDGPVLSVAFSPDGKTIATGSGDRTAQLWNTKSSQPVGLRLPHQQSVFRVLFGPDGKTVVTEEHDILRLWDAGATAAAIGRPLMIKRNARFVKFSSDGKKFLTTDRNGGLRLWDVATLQPIGPDLRHDGSLDHVDYSPDGRSIVMSPGRLWRLPALVGGDLDYIKLWVETMTGMEVEDGGNIKGLEASVWQERHDRLRELGGPPKMDPGWLVDPILFGADPTASARAWMERKRWAEAEAAFTEVIRARPLRSTGWLEHGRFYVMRSEPEKALADFVQALVLGSRDPKLVSDIIASDERFDRALGLLPRDSNVLSVELLFRRAVHLGRQDRLDEARAVLARAGTVPWEKAEGWGLSPAPGHLLALLGCSDQISALLRNYQQTTNPHWANEIAWSCGAGPGRGLRSRRAG